MMQKSTKDFSVIFISLLMYSLLCVFWPGQPDEGRLDITLACILHAVLYHLLAYNFSGYCKNPYFLKTPLAVSCLLLVVYFGVPFMKYYGEPRYVELEVELHYRLFGLVVICASILMILKLYAKKWILFYLSSNETMHRAFKSLFMPLMYSIFGISTFYLISGSIFVDNDFSAAKVTFIISGYFISLYYFALFGVQQKALWNELLFVSGGLAITYYSGQRAPLLLALLMLIFARISRIKSHNKRRSIVLIGLLVTPLALMLTLGPLTEMTKTRYGGVNLIFELQRTDFADFVGAAAKADHKENVFSGLQTSLLWAIPGGFIDKETIDYSMEPFFKKNNWRSSDYREGYTKKNIDYIDSIFASGAMVGGYLGALLFPLAWYGVFILVLSRFKNTLLLSFYMASIPSMFMIEIAFWTIVPMLRNWILFSLILFAILQSFTWLSRRRTRSFHQRLVESPGSSQHAKW